MKFVKPFIGLVLASFSMFSVKAQKPLNLKVLYVGGATNWEKDAFDSPEDMQKDIQRRTASFETMLKRYFTTVKVVRAEDYSMDMSERYDVTVMDGLPKPVKGRQAIKNAEGKVTKYTPAAYLTENFDKPVIFIGPTGETVGRSIGLKSDWYCLCLDAYAHNYRKDHAIFKGPFKTKMTEEILPTPEDAFHYEYFSDKPYPKTLNMWRVQTKGYVTDKNFKIGMVARPWGFEDSPDAEYISSGVCQKTLDAVALGRHGNFFHWGFAASPEYMTDEAQTVLANAIVYISKFDGKGVVARKYLDRRATKEWIKERKYLATEKAFNDYAEINKKFDARMLEEKKKAEEKKANNEKLSYREEAALDYKKQPGSTFEEFLKKNQGDLYSKFGNNSAAYLKYFDENYDYFYSEDAMYVINVDEDVKSLGIPNTDKKLLDKCISMLEKGTEVDKANRILHRYTLLDFKTPNEWRNWFEKNKYKIFFTQSGGWYFMVDTDDKNEPANDYHKEEQKEVSYENIQPGETSHENAVSVASGIVDLGKGKKEVVVKIKIHPGYHIYAFVSEKDPYINTELNVNLPSGYQKDGDLVKPSFKYFNEKGTTIYEDEVIFKQVILGSGKGEVTVVIRYQCCDSQICFPPVNEEYKIQI